MKTFRIQQNIRLLVNQYKVFQGDSDAGLLIAFAQQKRFAFREKFTLYASEQKDSVVAEIQARSVVDLGARYDIRDEKGVTLGVIGKAFGASLLKSTWNIYAPSDESTPLLIVQERNPVLAIIRRAWELIPYIGEIPFFVKYHFDFIVPSNHAVVGSYEKTTLLKDHYLLQIEDSVAEQLDWRVFVSLGIMLDALQSR